MDETAFGADKNLARIFVAGVQARLTHGKLKTKSFTLEIKHWQLCEYSAESVCSREWWPYELEANELTRKANSCTRCDSSNRMTLYQLRSVSENPAKQYMPESFSLKPQGISDKKKLGEEEIEFKVRKFFDGKQNFAVSSGSSRLTDANAVSISSNAISFVGSSIQSMMNNRTKDRSKNKRALWLHVLVQGNQTD